MFIFGVWREGGKRKEREEQIVSGGVCMSGSGVCVHLRSPKRERKRERERVSGGGLHQYKGLPGTKHSALVFLLTVNAYKSKFTRPQGVRPQTPRWH